MDTGQPPIQIVASMQSLIMKNTLKFFCKEAEERRSLGQERTPAPHQLNPPGQFQFVALSSIFQHPKNREIWHQLNLPCQFLWRSYFKLIIKSEVPGKWSKLLGSSPLYSPSSQPDCVFLICSQLSRSYFGVLSPCKVAKTFHSAVSIALGRTCPQLGQCRKVSKHFLSQQMSNLVD